MMEEIPDGSVDMILTDLPYGTTACKWDNIIPFDPMWKQYRRILKPDGVAALFAVQPFTTKLISSNLRDFRYCWYWKKANVTGGIFCKVQPMRCIEDIAIFYRRKPTYNPQGLRVIPGGRINAVHKQSVYGQKKNPSVQHYTGYPHHLLEFKKDAQQLHPTQKPVELLAYLIRTYTSPGEIILDSCMGSGSTCVAAIREGRKYIGFEKDSAYFETARVRIAEQAAFCEEAA